MDDKPTIHSTLEPRLVVGVGALAGDASGLFEEFVASLPSGMGMAFVLASDWDQEGIQALCESLIKQTQMAVVPLEDGAVIEPDHIYLVDSTTEHHLESVGALAEISSDWDQTPPGLDRIFGQLAYRFGSRSAGILLSSEDSEGVVGLQAVKQAEGLTMARAPDRGADHGLKPAIVSGAADIVIDVDYMPRSLERFAQLLTSTEWHTLLAAIVSSSDDAIISKTLNGVILSWNAGAERIFGYSAEEAIGQSVELIIPPELRDEERDILSKLRRGERIDHFETIRMAKNGQHLNISMTISPIRDPAGRIVAASKVARDITHRKRAEAALQEASERKDEYLAMLGHELRNPLAAIQSAGEVLKQVGTNSPELMERAVAILGRQTTHMAKLLDGLLDVSRITRGKLQVEKRPVDLSQVLRDVVAGAARAAERDGVELLLELGGKPLYVLGDATRLSQIFGNLVDNALKFTGAGDRVRISGRVQGGSVEVLVEDSGVGFPSDQGEYLFDIFSQGEQDLSRSHGGLGLGLALARGLVGLHNGTIQAFSEGMGHGAKFSVRLPRCSENPAEQKNEDSPSVNSMSIVVVEDNADLAHMLCQWLVMQGHRVEVAGSGESGLELVRERRPDVVICDLGLPGVITGYDLAKELREAPAFDDTRLIALSGYSRPEDKAKSRESGFDRHLTKPVEFSTLQQVLREVRGE